VAERDGVDAVWYVLVEQVGVLLHVEREKIRLRAHDQDVARKVWAQPP
jgi:hypothetical protein